MPARARRAAGEAEELRSARPALRADARRNRERIVAAAQEVFAQRRSSPRRSSSSASREGDRVAIYMPMCPAVAVASHACAHIGAVQVPIFSGLRRAGDRVAARGLAGEGRDLRRLVAPPRQARSRCARRSIEAGPYRGRARDRVEPRDAQLAGGRDAAARARCRRLEVDSEAPYLLAYTSGTTGRPKGALHVQGGFLVSIAREAAYQTRHQAGRPHPLRHRHGLDHGPVDRRRRRRRRRDDRLRRRRARTGRTTGSGGSSSRSR